jgi:hypothetical protein
MNLNDVVRGGYVFERASGLLPDDRDALLELRLQDAAH